MGAERDRPDRSGLVFQLLETPSRLPTVSCYLSPHRYQTIKEVEQHPLVQKLAHAFRILIIMPGRQKYVGDPSTILRMHAEHRTIEELLRRCVL
jgi:hypothetical protein